MVRNPDKVPSLAATQGVVLRKADLADRAALVRAFDGCDAVISNAGVISLGNISLEELIDANVQGTRNVFDAIAEAGVQRAVMTSSAVVYRPKRGHFYLEDDELRSAADRSNRFTHYAVSKAEAEREAWRLAEVHGIRLTSVRPHTVYGAFDGTGFTRWFRLFMRPRFLSVFPTHLRFPSVYAGDIGDAMCRMLERPVSVGRAYNIAGEPGVHSYYDHVGAFRRAGGAAPRVVVPFPVPIKRQYAIERAAADLDWTNRSLDDGFRDMLDLERTVA